MIATHFEVWLCVKDVSLSICATPEWSFCYVYDEKTLAFVPWVSWLSNSLQTKLVLYHDELNQCLFTARLL